MADLNVKKQCFFYIAVCHIVTLHAASKLNHRYNKQK